MSARTSLPLALLLAAALITCSDTPTAPRAEDFIDEPAPDPPPELVAFVDVNVVPMDADRVLRGQTVLVDRGRIATVGPVGQMDVPEGAFVIQGQGRYLMPGLADMHVHSTSQTFGYLRNDFMLWLANGVTTVRVMWGGTGIRDERDRIADGLVLGPNLLVASPGVDGPGGVWSGSTPTVANAVEARERVAQHAEAGYDFIKVYNDLTPEMYQAIVDEALSRNIPVVGHVPSRVGIEAVQDAGQQTLEHLIGFRLSAVSPPTGGEVNRARVRELAARSSGARVWHTPTVTVDALSTDRVAAIRGGPDLETVSPGMRSFFENGFHHGLSPSVAAREEENHELILREIHQAGGGVVVGTDAGFGWILPGYSIHDELRHFIEAGLSPFETLQAATSRAADAANLEEEFGQVREGYRADLILLARNPLRGLDGLRELSGVMVRGIWLSRGTLAERLVQIRLEYSAPVPSLVGATEIAELTTR